MKRISYEGYSLFTLSMQGGNKWRQQVMRWTLSWADELEVVLDANANNLTYELAADIWQKVTGRADRTYEMFYGAVELRFVEWQHGKRLCALIRPHLSDTEMIRGVARDQQCRL